MNYARSWKQEHVTEAKNSKEVVYGILCFVGSMALLCLLGQCFTDSVVRTAEIREQRLTPEQQQFKAFFQKHGSPTPEQMAIAVTQTKRPALMAAIAVVESNGDPKAVGDKGASKGAFQVQPKHWGKVPQDAVGQALQAERILEELLSSARHLRRDNPRLRVALARYNGGDRPPRISYRYADKVMRLAR